MKLLFLFLNLLISACLHAQYYYNDIIGTQENNRQMQTYIASKVKMVTATGYTPQGSKATDFAEVQQITDNGKTLQISRNSNMTHTAFYQRFDAQNRLISIIDTSLGIQNITTYEYDAGGKIILAQNKVIDETNGINMTEVHRWIYTKEGNVDKMWRTINGSDSLEIRFIPDEKGNPGEEHTLRNGHETDMLYYYFDDQRRITDIVRYDEMIKKLVPDNIITYDDGGRVIQIVTSSQKDNIGMGKLGKAYFVRYAIWRYVYNDKGLKIAEALFDANQDMTGRIKYTYTFEQ